MFAGTAQLFRITFICYFFLAFVSEQHVKIIFGKNFF